MNENHELERLLLLARAGDAQARDALFALLRGRARRYADYLLGAQPGAQLDASDVAQEALIRALRHFEPSAFATAPHVLAWLNEVVRNVVADLHRHGNAQIRDGRRNVAGGDLFPGLASEAMGPEDVIARAEDAARLAAALLQLPENQRLVFALRFHDGLPFEDIAARAGVSVGNARVLMLRATEALREQLGEKT